MFTLYILDFEPSVMCEIVHIMSASIYLLVAPFKAPLLMTLHRSGQAYFMYFCSGGGCPLHKLVIAHAPFLICNFYWDVYTIFIKAYIPPFFKIASRCFGLSAARFPIPQIAWSTTPFKFYCRSPTNKSIPPLSISF